MRNLLNNLEALVNNKNNFFSYLAGLVTGVVLFTAAYFTFLNFSYIKTLSLRDFKDRLPKTFVVYSGSMSPSLPVGSLIAIKPEEDYAVGDVISFRLEGGQVITHRISKVINDELLGVVSYQTKGDANNAPDSEPVSKNQILGEGFFALPYLGYLFSFLRTKTGFTIFVIIPAILIIFGEILSIKTEVGLLISKRSERKKKKISSRKPAFSFRLFLLLLLIAPFVTIGASNAYFSDDEGSNGNLMSAGTWGEEEWDKSSLYFDDDYSCQGDCEEIRARVCNGEDAENMEGPTTWELYWIESGNPKNGDLEDSGTIDALESGVCQDLIFYPEGGLGNYKFKAYQRLGHPGNGELWSETCELLLCVL